MNAKKYLVEILEYYIKRIEDDSCTMEEIESATRTLEENMEVHGTISDFASFYGKPEGTVRTTIFKKLIAKPVRVVLYPFHKFRRIVPDNWRKHNV